MSFHFTDLIRPDMPVRDVRARYPQTREIFERFGVRTPCWDWSVAEVALRSGVKVEELLGALNEAVIPWVPADLEKRPKS